MRINDSKFVRYCFYVWSQILKCWTCTKILCKFQILLKLPAAKSCACLSELPGAKFEGSAILFNGAAWSEMGKWVEGLLFWL